MILNIGGIVIARKCWQRAENVQSTIAQKMNTVYNETVIERGVLNEGREAGDSGNKWFSNIIPGEYIILIIGSVVETGHLFKKQTEYDVLIPDTGAVIKQEMQPILQKMLQNFRN